MNIFNAKVNFDNTGKICWIDAKRECQDYDTLKELGRGKNTLISGGGQRVDYKGLRIYFD